MKVLLLIILVFSLLTLLSEAKRHYKKDKKQYDRSSKKNNNYQKKHNWQQENEDQQNSGCGEGKWGKQCGGDKKYQKEDKAQESFQQHRPRAAKKAKSSDACPERATYDFNLLTLSWTGEFCTEHSCVCMWQADWNGQSATVHGFWPSGSAEDYLDCFGYQGDPNCMHEAFAFDYDLLGLDLRREMDINWPQYGGKTCGQFYEYEWDKHGTCYLMNMIEDHQEDYEKDPKAFNQTTFVKYFQNVIDKVEERNISLESGKRYETKEDFAKDIGIPASQFRVKCSKDDEVDEFQICYSRVSTPGEQVLMDCPQDYSSEGDCYGEPFFIK